MRTPASATPDAEGLYIDVLPSNKKTWLFRYSLNGKRKWLSLGEYPW
ncbi:MAG: Arm DNA-binding domain-containing protein [Synergistaceae bacterium]|nr:Arm DNA-binding domain-containing protein [Synergistaceae bacterium]